MQQLWENARPRGTDTSTHAFIFALKISAGNLLDGWILGASLLEVKAICGIDFGLPFEMQPAIKVWISLLAGTVDKNSEEPGLLAGSAGNLTAYLITETQTGGGKDVGARPPGRSSP
jgi:hypothetical protein